MQVPDTVTKLQSQLPIERAQMRVRLTFPVTSNKWVTNPILSHLYSWESSIVNMCQSIRGGFIGRRDRYRE